MKNKHSTDQAPQELSNDEVVTSLEARITELHEEVVNLRSQLFKTRDELHSLKNARLLGKIIKARDAVGATRHFTVAFPHKLVHGTRVAVAPLFPAPVRKSIKRVYRGVRARVNGVHVKPATTVYVKNVRWTNKPLVSVIIPYYNRAGTIDDTLGSLKSQTFTGFEIILVDDGSTEPASIQKLRDIRAGVPKVRVIHQPNQGVAAARNKGIADAKGKYIICLDSDDLLAPTFIEKATLMLESDPDVALATCHQDMFGVMREVHKNGPYDPLKLFRDNMVITAAEFRKEAWSASGGYQSGIGYEDWEHWLRMAERGFWGKLIPEELFLYRTSLQSRYVGDKDVHWSNLSSIRALHPNYAQKVKRLMAKRRALKHITEPQTALLNMQEKAQFRRETNGKPNVLITVPWMTFGGAETLIHNYCSEVKDDFNISFVTGLKSEHEWEYKFKEITPYIYHLPNLFDDPDAYVEFISNYIETRGIDVLHIIHNGFTFDMLPELKKRHPKLKVAVTMFNDRVAYFEQSIGFDKYIDMFVSDNSNVANHYNRKLGNDQKTTVISNGINCYDVFSQSLFDREKEREALGIQAKDTAVIFVGRLSEEKNPDVFLQAAKTVIKSSKGGVKFFMVGDGPMRPVIDKMLKDINSKDVTYLGYKDVKEVARHLSVMDVFVLPSSIEGFPLSILEAMAMEVAIIASDVGAVAEVVDAGKDGYVVTPGSASEIAQHILTLRKDAKLLQEMKKHARSEVETKYSNLVLGKNYKKMYRDLLL